MNIIDEFEKKHIEGIATKIATESGSDNINSKKVEAFCDRIIGLNIGDMVKVHYRIIEGKRERIQIYEGYVIAIKGKGISKTFKVRKISYGAPTCFEMFSVHQIPSILALTREKAHDTNLFLLHKAICHIGCSNCRSRVRHNWGIVSSRLLGATFLDPL